MIFENLQTTLLIIGAGVAILILLWLLLRRGWRRQSLKMEPREQLEREAGEPYAASRERPYVRDERAAAAAPLAPAEPPGGDRIEPEPLPPAAGEPEISLPPGEAQDESVARPAVPLMGAMAGIAFPPHSTDHPDELTRLKGVGPKLANLLNQEGITRYEQLASLDDVEIVALEDRLGTFKGRLTRDRVAEQARLLASGDTDAFEARFGKLGGA